MKEMIYLLIIHKLLLQVAEGSVKNLHLWSTILKASSIGTLMEVKF